MPEHLEFDPVDRITLGAVGEPGSRTFLLQAAKGGELRTWVLEKEHVMAIGTGSYALLSQIGQGEITREVLGGGALGSTPKGFSELMALEPDEPAFRIDPDSMAMGYDESREMVMISFAELVAPAGLLEGPDRDDSGDIEDLPDMSQADAQEEAEEVEQVLEERSTARLWLSSRQLAALGIHGMQIVAQGRPVCPLCGNVMEEGHKCPPHVFNGHGRKRDG